MGIDHIFKPGTAVYELASSEKYAALCELIRRAPVFREIADLRAFQDSVLTRERTQSTGFGHGVAVAHGRSKGLTRVLIAFGRSAAGIPFDAADGKPVRLLFVIASPQRTNLDYLHALSTLVRVLRPDALREALLASRDAAEAQRMIRGAFTACLCRAASLASP